MTFFGSWLTPLLAAPEFKGYRERLKSFKDWPLALPETPQNLAAAGFYYTGKSDICLCYVCSLGVRDIRRPNTAWVIHVEERSDCPHVLLNKGGGVGQTKEDAVKTADYTKCKVCHINDANIVFMSCQHVAACSGCVIDYNFKKCPYCGIKCEIKFKIFVA